MTKGAATRRPLDFLWFLPTSGDGAHLGSAIGRRSGTNRYLREIAEAVDRLGYLGVLIPTGRGCGFCCKVGERFGPGS